MSAVPKNYVCHFCAATYPLEAPLYRCTCGGFLDLPVPQMFERESLSGRERSIWRYRECYGLPEDTAEQEEGSYSGKNADHPHITEPKRVVPVTMGEGCTPLIKRSIDGIPLFFKLDLYNPSGSFKDRGASVLVTYARHLGVKRVVEDSSGNAGAALSAYASAAGIGCTVYVPDCTQEEKTVQMRMYGTQVIKVPGNRQDANEAALKAAETSFYASHLWHPYFIMGLKSAAFELWESMGEDVPETIILPLGSGGYLEGLFSGFESLKKAGYLKRTPRLVGVQSVRCQPLHTAFLKGLEDYARVDVEVSAAEGIAVQRPPRARAVLSALRGSGGFTVVVEEEEILDAAERLAAMGLYVEPTSAVTLAAWLRIERKHRNNAVLILTGSGLKATSRYAHLLSSPRLRSSSP